MLMRWLSIGQEHIHTAELSFLRYWSVVKRRFELKRFQFMSKRQTQRCGWGL